jgi:hypothetical protein
MAIPGLLAFVGPVIDKVLSFIPDPEQKARARKEFEDQIQQAESGFRDFVIRYEGAAKDVHPALQLYRGSVRPTITYGAVVGLFAAIWTNQPVDIIDMLFKLNLLTLAFWFGPKALERLGLDLSKSMKKE